MKSYRPEHVDRVISSLKGEIKKLRRELDEALMKIDQLSDSKAAMRKDNREIRKNLKIATTQLEITENESNERKQCLDSLTAELSKAKRKLRRMENSK